MQVQGDAIVRNNVLISAKGSGFASTDHQGKAVNLQIVHNTIINAGHAVSGGSWNGRKWMVLANNVIFSRDHNALHFSNGKDGVVITSNVIVGHGPKDGTTRGRGLEGFAKLTWDAAEHDVTPTAEAPFDRADAAYLFEIDFTGRKRPGPTSGAQIP
jgi:hypothetical protein